MKRLLQIWLVISGLLMVFRFGLPALTYGATGPGPLGNRWLDAGQAATLLLDADLRFFGAMMIGISVIFFWAIWRVEELRAVIYVLAVAVALGAAARIYVRIAFGNPGTAGTTALVIEVLIPIFLIGLQCYVGKEGKRPLK
jgi:hypothetical protein